MCSARLRTVRRRQRAEMGRQSRTRSVTQGMELSVLVENQKSQEPSILKF